MSGKDAAAAAWTCLYLPQEGGREDFPECQAASFRPAPEALGPGSRDRESQRETAGDLSLSKMAEASAQHAEADETWEGC